MNTETLKLKDYENNPEQYNKITQLLNSKGIKYTDESKMSDILQQVSNFNQSVNIIADAANLRRGR